jgi:hypothetical protein
VQINDGHLNRQRGKPRRNGLRAPQLRARVERCGRYGRYGRCGRYGRSRRRQDAWSSQSTWGQRASGLILHGKEKREPPFVFGVRKVFFSTAA